MADGTLQVLGLMRWSYPSDIEAFEAPARDLEERRAQLYAPARMEERLFFLEHVTLPCLRAQTDRNFRLLMLMGERLPERWRVRVLALTRDIPQVVPLFEPEGQRHAEVCRRVMKAHRYGRAAAVAEFRLDDDDAMALDFVAATRRAFRQNRALLTKSRAFCLDYSKGFALLTGPGGVEVRPIFAQHVGIAQALIYGPRHRKSLLDYPHRRLWTAMPTLTLPDPVKWVRGIHRTNDSGIAESVRKLPTWPCEADAIPLLLASEFAIDWVALRDGWARLEAGRAAGGLRPRRTGTKS
ncbi:MAG: glycosyltransferase [Pseudomonadota bacterium]